MKCFWPDRLWSTPQHRLHLESGLGIDSVCPDS